MVTTIGAEIGSAGVTRQEALGQQVASAIRREIVLGRLKAGTVLPQDKLCELYQVSRIPVRDALLALSNEGFLVPSRRGQMVVSQFTREDFLDTFRVNAYLSGLAAARAAKVADEADMDELDRLVAESEKLNVKRHRDRIASLTWEFHWRVNRASRSARLLATLRATSIPLVQDFMRDIQGWWDVTPDEHREIAKAIRARDAERAQDLMSSHFDHAATALEDFVSEQNIGSTLDDVGVMNLVT